MLLRPGRKWNLDETILRINISPPGPRHVRPQGANAQRSLVVALLDIKQASLDNVVSDMHDGRRSRAD
jgi:hypothetical protein